MAIVLQRQMVPAQPMFDGVAEKVEETGPHGRYRSLRYVPSCTDRVSAPYCVLEFGQLGRYLVESLVPGDALPLVLAALPYRFRGCRSCSEL